MSAPKSRRGPVGPGYMPKGGRAAAQAHNARVLGSREAATPAAPVASAVQPRTDATRTDVRASARPGESRPDWMLAAAVGCSAVGAAASLLGLVVR